MSRTAAQIATLEREVIPACELDGDRYTVHVWKDGFTRYVVQYDHSEAEEPIRVWWITPTGQMTWNLPVSYGRDKVRVQYPWA